MTFGSFYFKRLMRNTQNEPVRLEQYVYVKAFIVNVYRGNNLRHSVGVVNT